LVARDGAVCSANHDAEGSLDAIKAS
jgi:hypothetical protein